MWWTLWLSFRIRDLENKSLSISVCFKSQR